MSKLTNELKRTGTNPYKEKQEQADAAENDNTKFYNPNISINY